MTVGNAGPLWDSAQCAALGCHPFGVAGQARESSKKISKYSKISTDKFRVIPVIWEKFLIVNFSILSFLIVSSKRETISLKQVDSIYLFSLIFIK